MKVLFAGGGTGGHVYPAVAIAGFLRRTVVDFEALFVGSAQGMESRIVPRAGFVLAPIPGAGLRRVGWWGRLRAVWALSRGIVAALGIVRRWRPDVVVATGGWASLAGGVAAAVARRPLLVQEQNAIPGFTNRFLARFARQVHVAFPAAAERFGAAVRQRVRVTGNPVRDELVVLGATPTGAPAEPPTILVVGGSRGARSINAAVSDAIPRVAERHTVRWLWQTGDVDHAQHRERWQGAPGVECVPYVEDMAKAYARATVVVCRAGAMTLAELAVVGVPAILVPFPGAVDDHQTANARYLVEAGASVLIADADLDGARLAAEIDRLLAQPGRLDDMRQRLRRLAQPQATRHLAEAVIDLAAPSEGVAYVRSC